MAFNIIGAIVLLLSFFGLLVNTIGVVSFTQSLQREYNVTTYHMADTAATLVNGDHLEDYLRGEEMEEYQRSKGYLDGYCRRMNVSLVYVIVVDKIDYGRFVSVFNSVDNEVDNTNYAEWEIGYERDTTNDEYREKYRALYEDESLYETVYRLKVDKGLHPHITTLVPIRNSSEEVTGILCVQRPIREIQDARKPFQLKIIASTIGLGILASIVTVLFIRSQFVAPIRRVSDEATRFAKENIKGKELGAISPYEDLANLAQSIDKMETDMVSYIENLTEATAEKERIGVELNLARKIQENSIPNTFPAFPDRTDFDIYAVMDPAKEVGGDFYNFFLIDEDHLALVVGDVSGKGIPGSLFMMVTNILISDRTHMGGTPAEILSFVNHHICEHNRAGMFVTVWLGILELSTGKLVAANAGHEYPVLKRSQGEFELYKDRHGFVLGGMENVVYREYKLDLKPGDKVFIYSDGVPEATAEDNSMFGIQRMITALNKASDSSPQHILSNVRSAVDDFVNGAEQFDDLTMLCLEYKGWDEKEDKDG